MTLEEMQRRKREFGYSNEKLAELSGVPLGTVQKVMSGSTKSPRQGTLEALARALSRQMEAPVLYPGEMIDGCIRVLREPWGAYTAKKEEYTIEDIYALPEGVRAELIDGEIYYMATPTRIHQKIVGEMHLAVAGYIRSHGGACEVYIPRYAVYLNADNSIYLEPDLTVICDLSKSEDKGCVGAPDWVVNRRIKDAWGRRTGLLRSYPLPRNEWTICSSFSNTAQPASGNIGSSIRKRELFQFTAGTTDMSRWRCIPLRMRFLRASIRT